MEERLAVLVEVDDKLEAKMEKGGENERREVEEKVWREVQLVNRDVRDNEVIPKENVILVEGEKRLPRSAKGDVQRKAAAGMFKDEIEKFRDNYSRGCHA